MSVLPKQGGATSCWVARTVRVGRDAVRPRGPGRALGGNASKRLQLTGADCSRRLVRNRCTRSLAHRKPVDPLAHGPAR